VNYPQEIAYPVYLDQSDITNQDIAHPVNLELTYAAEPAETVFGGMSASAIPKKYFPSPEIALINSMRMAWEQHVFWTRLLLISIAERLKDLDATTKRLLRNPDDIANIFAVYYPPAIAKKISQLLTEHLQIGAALITALRDGKSGEAKTLDSQWYKNADEMAAAFASINPYYDREELRKMLHRHLDLTKQEVAMRLAGNYPADIEAFDRVELEAIAMADYFTTGIIRQFPHKF